MFNLLYYWKKKFLILNGTTCLFYNNSQSSFTFFFLSISHFFLKKIQWFLPFWKSKNEKKSIHIGVKFQFHYSINPIYTTFIIIKDDNSNLKKHVKHVNMYLPLMDHESLRTTDIRKRTLKIDIDGRKSVYESRIWCNDHDCKTTWLDSSIDSIKNHWKIINYLYFVLYINYYIYNLNI